MLQLLRSFNPDRADLEDMLALIVFARGLRAAHEEFKVAVPEWLDDKIRALNREIVGKTRDALELRLKEVRQAKTQLMTPSERREALAKEEAELEAQLNPA